MPPRLAGLLCDAETNELLREIESYESYGPTMYTQNPAHVLTALSTGGGGPIIEAISAVAVPAPTPSPPPSQPRGEEEGRVSPTSVIDLESKWVLARRRRRNRAWTGPYPIFSAVPHSEPRVMSPELVSNPFLAPLWRRPANAPPSPISATEMQDDLLLIQQLAAIDDPFSEEDLHQTLKQLQQIGQASSLMTE